MTEEVDSLEGGPVSRQLAEFAVDDGDDDHEARRVLAAVRQRLVGSKDRLEIGRFAVEDKLGEGGMGVVYRAYDRRLDRRVAIKLLRATTAGERLRREAQALARLSHPNVLQVFDVGVFEGRVYLVLELVEGSDIAAWLRERPRSPASIRRVFRDAARGLWAAHRAGIVHRDFKPGNVLIGKDGRVRVADFGLASWFAVAPETTETRQGGSSPRSDSKLTATGSILGTPAYMAPEQSKPGCVIDARADQFSLCVALFEALYRQRPRGEDTRGGAGGHLRDQSRLPSSPRLPKTLGEALRRGLATDPDDRYPTLEPIIAALSHRKASGIDIAKGLLAVAGVSLAGVLMVSPQAPDQASARCPSSQERLRNIWDADRALALAQGLSATGLPYTDNMSARVLTHVRSWVDEWSTAYAETCERMKTGPVDRSGDRRMLCLVGQLRSFETMLNGLAEADTRQPGLGLTAVMSLEPPSACTGAGELPVPSEAHRAEQVAFVRALLARASVAQQLGDLDEAERLGEEALGYGKPIAFPPLNAELEIRQAATGRARGRLEEAAEHARLAFFIAADNDHARAAAQAAEQLVFVVGYRLHRYQEAAQWFRHARTQLERFGGDAQLDAAVHNAFGAVRRIEGAAEHALELHRTAIELRRSAVGRDDEKVAVFLMNSANVLFDLGRYSEGLVVFERVLSLQERSLGPQHPALAQTLNNVGAALLTVGDKERAESFMMRALAVRERSLGADHLLVGRTLSNLGSLARSLGRTLEAANYQARALAILELALGPQHPDLAIVLNNLANTQIDRGELDAAHDALRRSLEIRVSAFGESHDKVSRARMSLAGLHLQRGELDDALVEFSLALDIARAVYPMAHPLKARILTRKADVLLRLGRGDDALHDVQEAVESNAAEPPGPSHLLETQFVHAQALAATGSERRARVVARSAHNRASQMGEHGKAWVDEIGRWLVTLPAPTRNGESSLPPP